MNGSTNLVLGMACVGYFFDDKYEVYINTDDPGNEPHFHIRDVLPGRQHAGSCGIMSEAEARGLRYLFKIKCTGLAKELFEFLAGDNEWKDSGGGWEAHEHHLQLSTWKLTRRPIFIRRPAVKGHTGIAVEQKALPTPEGGKTGKVPHQLTAHPIAPKCCIKSANLTRG